MVRVNLSGTDWVLVSTTDGKKYYYNNKTKVGVVMKFLFLKGSAINFLLYSNYRILCLVFLISFVCHKK